MAFVWRNGVNQAKIRGGIQNKTKINKSKSEIDSANASWDAGT